MITRITLCAALAVAALAGCGSGASSAPAVTPSSNVTAATLACKQLYLGWKNGPAQAAATQFVAAQKALQTVGSTKDLPAIAAAVETEGRAAASLAQDPVPACADPHGYFATLLSRVQAAAASAGTAQGLSALVQAMAPLTQAPTLEGEFTAELKRTTGI
jgi:hypothetical protein